MWCRTLVDRIWGWYVRFFRVMSISCNITPARDVHLHSQGFTTAGLDPQLAVRPIEKPLFTGWYRLTYDASHTSSDDLFVPKIFPGSFLDNREPNTIHYPRGFAEKNLVGLFLRSRQDALAGVSQPTALPSSEPVPSAGSPENSPLRYFPAGSVINLRPHLPGKSTHLFHYAFDPEGFRFDPFELDFPRTRIPFTGNFELNDFKLTYYGNASFLVFCALNAFRNLNYEQKKNRICSALGLFRKKGADALTKWLAHKAYLSLQPPFSPTLWYDFLQRNRPDDLESAGTDCFSDPPAKPSFALFIFVGKSNPGQLDATLKSALQQTHKIDELIVLVSKDSPPKTRKRAQRSATKHPSVRTIACEIQNFETAIAAVSSDVVCLAAAGDRLLSHAVTRLTRTIVDDDADIVYADEVIMGDTGRRVRKTVLRPGFCLDHFLNYPVMGLMTAIRRNLLHDAKAFIDCQSIEAANERLILDALTGAKRTVHIPDVVYERLQSDDPPALRRLPPSSVTEFLQRLGFHQATVNPAATPGLYSIRYNHALPGKTGIVIPTKNKGQILKLAVDSLERTVPRDLYDLVVVNHESDDPETVTLLQTIAEKYRVIEYQGSFNFSSINNVAAKCFDETINSFLFLNNDVEAIRDGWLETMRDLLGRREVGIVGATLLYPDPADVSSGSRPDADVAPHSKAGQRSVADVSQDGHQGTVFDENAPYLIQHAGVILNVGVAEHYQKTEQYLDVYTRNTTPNPAIPSLVTRSFSAVTAACLLIRRDVFETLGGFDEALAVGFQDVDLCLRAANEGYQSLCSAEAVLFHHESLSRDVSAADEKDPHPADTTTFHHRYLNDIGSDPFYPGMLSRTVTHYRPLRVPYSNEKIRHQIVDCLRPEPLTTP